ncbi:hypothetical protein KFE25_014307 [Diacronema lutheri]|uniref:Uncharacterized protein n=1 Tax=Diacronema lutheri TaxID=2081491 RepID=A0A8J6C2U6_DIALT|nr:hypothetical protein KFE25_014307 [Diacronema lutheri]
MAQTAAPYAEQLDEATPERFRRISTHDSIRKEPRILGSSPLELALALAAGTGACAALALAPIAPAARGAIACVWLYQAARLHLQVWRFGGWAGFVFLCRRFPHAYVWTLSTLPVFLAAKLAQWVCAQLFLDNAGRMHRCEPNSHGGADLTLVNWWRMATDLSKPLRVHSVRASVMPNIIAPTLACNVHSVGAWASLDVLRVVCSEHSCSMRNDLFGTNFSYTFHISGVVDESHMYWLVTDATVLWPLTALVSAMWNGYAATLADAIAEAEARSRARPAVTYTGLRFWTDHDPPTLDSLWYPHLRERRPSEYVMDS